MSTYPHGYDELNEAIEEIARLKQWIDDLQSGMYINCVYCGHRYGPGETTPVTMADALKAHIEVCPEHPMSKLKSEVEKLETKRIALRKALMPFKYAAARDGNVLLASDEDMLYVRTAQGNFVPVYGIIGGLQIKDLRDVVIALLVDEKDETQA